MLLMYVAMAALARRASTYPFGIRYPHHAAQPPWPVANATRPDTKSRDMTDTAA